VNSRPPVGERRFCTADAWRRKENQEAADVLFPHEAPELLCVRDPDEQFFAGAWGAQNRRLAAATLNYLTALNIGGSMASVCTRFYELWNGAVGGALLSRKVAFGDLVRDAGYRAPVGELLPPGLSLEQVREKLLARFPLEQPLFCKPSDGFRGRGASLLPDRASAAAFLRGQREPYLAQSFEAPIEDWRYILHRDRRHLRGDPGGRTWRIAYKKVRPCVTGDGRSSVATLLENASDIPVPSKKKVSRHLSPGLRRVVPRAGERLDLAGSGNISRGAYGQLPERSELANMDAFMLRFHTDLEAWLHAPVATSCLDVGVKSASALRGTFEFDRLRREIVFFEFQLPFGVTGYRRHMPVPPARNRLFAVLPETTWRFCWRQKTMALFFLSISNSGRSEILARR
jgi:hypothetical protein